LGTLVCFSKLLSAGYLESYNKKQVSIDSLPSRGIVSGSSELAQSIRTSGEANMTGQEEHMLTHFLINLGDLVGSFVLERHLEGVA
jgi:hypothetical protein